MFSRPSTSANPSPDGHDLDVWVHVSDESPLTSEGGDDDSRKFGDLTLISHDLGEDIESQYDMCKLEDELKSMPRGSSCSTTEVAMDALRLDKTEVDEETMEALLGRILGRHDDVLATLKSRYRFSVITEFDSNEELYEPDLVRVTNLSTWPCDLLEDAWFKIRLYFAKKCKLPCCQELTWPQEMVRRRRFHIPKKTYATIPDITSYELDAVLRWSDLVSSSEWREGVWTERGTLHMSDKSKFRTGKVTWSAMEEHLANLAYSGKESLVYLAARICIECLAKNRAMSTHGHQYWAFARLYTDLIKSTYPHIRYGLLMALQLHLRTVKIFHGSHTTKYCEYASAGLFPVLLDLLGQSDPPSQAAMLNVLILMSMHSQYINLITNMGGLSSIFQLTRSADPLVKRRAYACLEIVAKQAHSRRNLVELGVFPLAVSQLGSTSKAQHLSSLFILNSLCYNGRNLQKILAVNNSAVVKSVMRVLTEWTVQNPIPVEERGQSPSIAQISRWCTIPRQNLLLLTKLCADESASRQMVRKGLVLKLKAIWCTTDSESEQLLVMDSLLVLARHPRAAEKICREGFLPLLAEHVHDPNLQEQLIELISLLGRKHLLHLLDSGLMGEVIESFGNKLFPKRLHLLLLGMLANFITNDKVVKLLLSEDGKPYSTVLDLAVLLGDPASLQYCITILSRMNSNTVPVQLLHFNRHILLAYIEKLLTLGLESVILHGLMQLLDLLTVHCMHVAFSDHGTAHLVEPLSGPPYKQPVQFMANKVLEAFKTPPELPEASYKFSESSHPTTGSSVSKDNLSDSFVTVPSPPTRSSFTDRCAEEAAASFRSCLGEEMGKEPMQTDERFQEKGDPSQNDNRGFLDSQNSVMQSWSHDVRSHAAQVRASRCESKVKVEYTDTSADLTMDYPSFSELQKTEGSNETGSEQVQVNVICASDDEKEDDVDGDGNDVEQVDEVVQTTDHSDDSNEGSYVTAEGFVTMQSYRVSADEDSDDDFEIICVHEPDMDVV